jgi:hypothetical protein
VAERRELRAAVATVAALCAAGALLGVVWSAWSGAQQRAFVLPDGLYPYDEVETMAAADSRYLLLVGVVGLLAALLVWRRRGVRGPAMLVALCLGGLGGAALTWWIGYLTGGGSYAGKVGTTIRHLPLTLHMRGLLFVEPALAALVYGVLVAFAARDDLGRPDPVRARLSVPARHEAEHGWRHSDAASALQQGEFPAQ